MVYPSPKLLSRELHLLKGHDNLLLPPMIEAMTMTYPSSPTGGVWGKRVWSIEARKGGCQCWWQRGEWQLLEGVVVGEEMESLQRRRSRQSRKSEYKSNFIIILMLFLLIFSARATVAKEKETPPPTAQAMPMPDLTSQPLDPDEPTYCLCQQVSFGEMIGCDNDDVSDLVASDSNAL